MTFTRLARQSLSRLSFSEVARWGFLLMLPAAVLGSFAAWPAWRTLSAFRILYAALALGGLVWILYHRRLPPRVHVWLFVLFLGVWVAWTLLSLTWAVDRAAGIRYSIFLVMMASLSGGTVLAVNDVKALRTALYLLLAVFCFSLAIALLEITTDFRLPTSGLVGRPERYQWAVTSFFHNQNDFATYIALWLPFLLAVPLFTRRAWAVIGATAGSLLSIVCLLYTGSRTNLLALALGIPSLLLLLAFRKGTSSRWWQWVLGIVLIGAVASTACLGMSGALPVVRLPEIGVQHWRFDTLGAEIEAGSGSGGTRINLIAGGLAALRDSAFLGVGPGNAEYHLRQMPALEAVYNLHNWWMEVLVNGGVFIFVGYLLFYAGLVYGLFRTAMASERRLVAFAAVSLLSALVGYTFGALSPSSAIHFTPMWIHFGLSMAVINMYRKQRADGRGGA
jgi:teichuronic acid biosynthesis protein TuaE